MPIITENNRRWWLLAAVSCVLGLVLLDETAVGVALPTIQKDLSLSATVGHWVVNAYLLSFACFVAVSGRLADQFGILRMFRIGLAIFATFSVLGGLAPTGSALIAARALQGVGAAVIFPLFVAMTTMTFPREQRGTALGLGGAVGTVFLASGPFVGGMLTDLVSWRLIFWVNPPIVLAIAIVSALSWRDVSRPPRTPIDWTGLVLIASGMFCLVFSLMEAEDWGWDNPFIICSLLLGAALLAGFVWVELHQKTPLIEVDLFQNRMFATSNLVMFYAQYAKMPIFVFAALYAQQVLGFSPLGAGMLIMLSAVLQPFIAPLCGSLTDRMHPSKLVYFGLLGMLVCMILLSAGVIWSSLVLFGAALLIAGIAFPFLFIPTQTVIMASLPDHKHGQGGGITMTAQMIGGTISIAVSSALFALGNDFSLVFIATGALTGVVLIVCLFGLSKKQKA
ncbi:EmrB/QacA subfamily drug resistance transporter [Roseibium hamelinense]|uniref:EmrB/QacA subfamily drug resistance transporter n=1 Tax=Roseibium hamelinense TaxID=150831 RepID=A0A562SM10_9HYPH|nr:DHA2 family efflux MFS transporter permease subunit [Roseibium hamelinense]MTI44917.1 DHA2 family efflux MFS transporter permease subunit [Roseibium hamelinense]TWI82178.1 EmrB/QacA subfamily drug resistance transporter [Roseibium hamelinense]